MGWSRVVKRGSAWPPESNFCPSGCLVRHQIGFQTPHNGPTGQCFQGRHHWPTFGLLGPPLGAPKRPLHEQIKPVWNLRKSQKSIYWVKNVLFLWWPPRRSILDQIWSLWAIRWIFHGPKGPTWYRLGPQNSLICPKRVLWEPVGGPKRSKNGSVMPTLETLASWTIMWCSKPNLVP